MEGESGKGGIDEDVEEEESDVDEIERARKHYKHGY